MQRTMLLALAGFAITFLTSCGDDAATSKFTAASGTVSKTVAITAKAALATGATFTLGAAPSNLPTPARSFEACTTKTPADSAVADVDGDRVKTQSTVYACTDVAGESGGVSSLNGSTTVTDADDNDAVSGFDYSYDVTGSGTFTRDSRAQTNTSSYKGNWKLVKDSATGGFTYSSDYKYEGTEVSPTKTDTYLGGGTWTWAVTPTSVSAPKDAGTVAMDGFYAYNYTEESVNKNAVFKMSSSGLKYDKTCSNSYYKEGSVTYTDGAANAITITFTCNGYTVKYNDEVI